MNKKIGFIGAGNMATAIISGIIKSQLILANDINAFDLSNVACEKMETFGVNVLKNACSVVESSDIIFLAVKPQTYPDVLKEISFCSFEKKIVVTIAAGISSDYIKGYLGENCKIVRAMPNTPLLLGCGATALSACSSVSDEEFNSVRDIFSASGSVCRLDEKDMNSVISVNGSSPAYIYLFAKAIIDGAKEQNIDPETAKALIAQTLIGSAYMLTQSGNTPEELIKMVSSPGGTTLAALDVFYKNNFEQIIKNAMTACTNRAEELGK